MLIGCEMQSTTRRSQPSADLPQMRLPSLSAYGLVGQRRAMIIALMIQDLSQIPGVNHLAAFSALEKMLPLISARTWANCVP